MKPWKRARGNAACRKLGTVVMAVAAMIFMLPATAGAVDTGRHPASLLPVPAAKPVPVHALPSHPVKVPAMRPWQRPKTTWPASGRAPKTVSASMGSQVTMASQAAAKAAGVQGVIFTVAPAASSRAGKTHVTLDYSSFKFGYGGDYASRLRLVELPACALTTPSVAACRKQTPVRSANNVRSAQLGADIAMPPSAQTASTATAAAPAATGAVVLAATSTSSGSAGDYTATPLSEAGSWSAGGSSGAFTYSYPISVPSAPGGLEPQVSLGYNSQAVDGLTSSSNNQSSWIGDGWDYSPGYVERDYSSCETQPPGTTGWVKSGDLCWSSNDTTTLSLGGSTATLVNDPKNGWHAEEDNGDKVQYLTGAGNSTGDGGYWVVTTPDGDSFYFGQDHLPGWASGDQSTESAWNVPVYDYQSGTPCGSNTHCYLPWRWNLDYVTDSHGNAMALFYNYESNYYAQHNGTTGSAQYQTGGQLATIEYGLRAGTIYGSTAGTLATPAAKVTFTSSADRTDVPTDLACASGASCNVISPTFWSKNRLTTITTSALKGSTMTTVDSWALKQGYPSTGDGSADPPMWLQSIQRTGEDGTAVQLPPVSFAGISLANRVETSADLNDGYSIIERMRMASITNETGGLTQVSYDTPPSSCTSGNFPAENNDTTLCYADYWTPPGATVPVKDWFNKYVTTSVTALNTVGGTIPVTTNYSYSGAAWHFNDDALTRSSQRTWDQWRGFQKVTSETGNAADGDPVTETTDTYFQGMDGDYQGSGTAATSASLTSPVGGVTVTDSDQFDGMTFEHTVYNGAGGPVVSDAVTTPWTSAATATQSQPSPLPALTAYMTGTAKTQTFTALASGGYREADETFGHDSYGQVIWDAKVPDASDNGAAGDASEDTCTQTTYVSNTTEWLLDLPAEQIVTSVPPSSCPVSGTPPQSKLVSDTQSLYDGATSVSSDTPSKGDVTETLKATGYSSGTEVFTPQSENSVDEYGRVTSAKNADAIADSYNATKTAYTPATGAEPTAVTVTDPMGLVTTTTYDPLRDLPLTVTNPAGLVTTEQYDALGRLTAVWSPGHATSGPADKTFSYTVSNTAPSVVTTNTINVSGSYLPSETLYDSLGRQAETQSQTIDGGRDITDTFYNSDGWVQTTSNPYYATGTPSGKLEPAADGSVPSQTGYVYDGADRTVRQITYSFASEKWETDTSYGGDYTTVTPPSGGTASTTYVNGDGKTSYIYQYHSATPPSAPPASGSGSQSGSSGWDQTAYTYTPAAQLAGITDAAGSKWAYSYDLSGNQVSAATPDTGTTTTTFDPDGNALSETDSRGKTLSFVYDADGRKTYEYDTTGGAAESTTTQRAKWVYDTLAKGQLTQSVSTPTGTTGTSYAENVTGYNVLGLPQGETVKVTGGTFSGSYTASYGYTPYANLPNGALYSSGGGLPQEETTIGYDAANRPASLGSGLWTYVANTSYTELGQLQEYALGTTDNPVDIINSYDQVTGDLATSGTTAGTNPVTLDSTTYSHDNAGHVTSVADTPTSGPAQVQCFQYDYLGRVSQAWSQATSGCSAGASQSAEAGAAAPYWEQYQYDSENNMISRVSTPASGSATTVTSSFTAGTHEVASQSSATGTGTAANTTFGWDAAGNIKSVAAPGNTQTLTWGDDGSLASVAATGGSNPGTTAYQYDADGTLIEQDGPTAKTLFLPWEELTVTTSGGTTTVSGTRYYDFGGTTIAARTSAGTVSYLSGNQEGTSTLAIDSSTLTPTYRYYDPFGNPVGTAPSSWPGLEGFQNGTADTDTGLENIGAREYDPGISAFTSPDPLLTPTNPQGLNPYAYASDSPPSMEDPTGQMACNADGACSATRNSGGDMPYGQPADYGSGRAPAGDSGIDASSEGYSSPQACDLPGDLCNPAIYGGYFGTGLPPRPAPPAVRVVKPKVVDHSIYGPSMRCDSQMEFKLGACPGESGAAGTTPAQVKQSIEGAGMILLSAIPIADIFGAIGGLGDASAAAEDVAPDLPAYAGGKTSGVLVRSDGSQVPLQSGYDGPALGLPKPRPGMNGNIVSHVEAHAAAIMRSEGLDEANLYINRTPCGGANGCMLNVSRMVPSGSTLNIYVMPQGSAGAFEDWINVTGTG